MKIKKAVVIEMINHAKKEMPLECCGYLAAEGSMVVASYALTNVDKSSEHFSFDPQEQFAVLRDVRSKGLEIIAVYHSHPASPARPSDEDIRLAHDPDKIYVIVSLAQVKEEVKAFKIKGQKAEPEILEVIYD